MRASFVNNLSFELSGVLSAGALGILVPSEWAAQIENALKGPDWGETYRSFLPITFESEGNLEIAYITDIDPNGFADLLRGREGTDAQEWQAGTKVENRLTAASANNLWHVNEDGNAVYGIEAKADGWGSVAICWAAYAEGDESVAIGSRAHAKSQKTIAVGAESEAEELGVSIGYASKVKAVSGVAVGGHAEANESAVALGLLAKAEGLMSTAIGDGCESSAEGSVAIGNRAKAEVEGGFRVGAMAYLAKNPAGWPAKNHNKNTSSTAVFALDEIDLASSESSADLELPENTILLIDSLDFVITESGSPGGNPEIKIGTDSTDDDTLLAATEITETGLHNRMTFGPAHSNGVTSVRVSTATAGSGTLKGKLVVRGYVMEV